MNRAGGRLCPSNRYVIAFNCTKRQKYLEFYLKTDVHILAEIFLEFRVVCRGNYGVDPAE